MKCVNCKKSFKPERFNQSACSYQCAAEKSYSLLSKRSQKQKKEERKIMVKAKESLLTHKDYLNMLQVVFNTWIRLRDKYDTCISCNRPLINKYDAGHFYSVGGNPSLRFNEDNVHGQCVHCNRDKHGNLLEYNERLPKRIGEEKYYQLKNEKNKVVKLSIPEIKEKLIHYKQLIKKLKK